MNNKVINPNSKVLQQADGHWQKLAALIVWKVAGMGKVVISADDIEAMNKCFAPGMPTLLTHEKVGRLEFSLVTEAEARRLAEFNRQTGGEVGGS